MAMVEWHMGVQCGYDGMTMAVWLQRLDHGSCGYGSRAVLLCLFWHDNGSMAMAVWIRWYDYDSMVVVA